MFNLRNHKVSRTVLLLASLGLIGGGLVGCSNSQPKTHHAKTTEVSKATSHQKCHKKAHKHAPKVTKHNKQKVNHQLTQNVKNIPGQKTTKQNLEAKPSSSVAKATAQSSHQPVSKTDGLPTVSLGNGVQGEEDRGAGQEFVSFKVNDTPIIVHGNDVQPGHDAVNKAKQIVQHPQNYQGNKTVHINA